MLLVPLGSDKTPHESILYLLTGDKKLSTAAKIVFLFFLLLESKISQQTASMQSR